MGAPTRPGVGTGGCSDEKETISEADAQNSSPQATQPTTTMITDTPQA